MGQQYGTMIWKATCDKTYILFTCTILVDFQMRRSSALFCQQLTMTNNNDSCLLTTDHWPLYLPQLQLYLPQKNTIFLKYECIGPKYRCICPKYRCICPKYYCISPQISLYLPQLLLYLPPNTTVFAPNTTEFSPNTKNTTIDEKIHSSRKLVQ